MRKNEFLRTLGLNPLGEFVKQFNQSKKCAIPKESYIKYEHPLPKDPDPSNKYSVKKMIEKSIKILLVEGRANILCAGIQRTRNRSEINSLENIHLNFTLKYLKRREWTTFLRVIGNELTEFLLTKCCIVQEIEGNLVLIIGNPRNFKNQTIKTSEYILRDIIFHKIVNFKRIKPLWLLEYIFGREFIFDDLKKKFVLKNEIHKEKHIKTEKISFEINKITGICKKIEKKDVRKYFNKYFESKFHAQTLRDSEIDHLELVNFLFMYSKKKLTTIFSFRGMRILKSKINEYITRNRYETINRYELTSHFKISHFKIFKNHIVANSQDHVRKNDIIFKLLKSVFEHIYIPILSNFLYITEGYSNYKIFFYPRKMWSHFSNEHLKYFLRNFSRTYIPNSFGVNPRCIPKQNGFRVVVNKSKKDGTGRSENLKLANHHLILSEEMKKNYQNSLLNYNDIFIKFRHFNFYNCYILKFDIEGCFDSIPHSIFQEELKKLLSCDIYHVKKYYSLSIKGDKIVTKRNLNPFDGSRNHKNFPFTKKHNPNEILYDNVYIDIKKKDNLIKEINNFITQNTLIFENSLYVQRRGLPQGSILSPILCYIFFEYLDRQFFNQHIKLGKIFRYVDDFLVATPDISELYNLFKNINEIEKKGIKLNMSKIEANFDLGSMIYEDNGKIIAHKTPPSDIKHNADKDITFCGMKIACIGAKINHDSAKTNFAGSFSSFRPGLALKRKILRFSHKFFKKIYFDTENIKRYQNIYLYWIHICRRILNFMRKLPFINKKFIYEILNGVHTDLERFLKNDGLFLNLHKILNIKNSAMSDSGLLTYLEITVTKT